MGGAAAQTHCWTDSGPTRGLFLSLLSLHLLSPAREPQRHLTGRERPRSLFNCWSFPARSATGGASKQLLAFARSRNVSFAPRLEEDGNNYITICTADDDADDDNAENAAVKVKRELFPHRCASEYESCWISRQLCRGAPSDVTQLAPSNTLVDLFLRSETSCFRVFSALGNLIICNAADFPGDTRRQHIFRLTPFTSLSVNPRSMVANPWLAAILIRRDNHKPVTDWTTTSLASHLWPLKPSFYLLRHKELHK